MYLSEYVVCVVINDNNCVWYEMFVLFLLLLWYVGYDGWIVVIGYGLFECKWQIFVSQLVDVIDVLSVYVLLVGCFIEVVGYCVCYLQICKFVLYDVDIWFCVLQFDLFLQIGDDWFYVCFDLLFCMFVVMLLIGEWCDYYWCFVVDEVNVCYGGVL